MSDVSDMNDVSNQSARLATWDTPENARLYRAYTENHQSYREWSDRLVALCDIAPGMTVLDLGCGTGATSAALHRAHGDAIRIIALDGSEAQLEQAREHVSSTAVSYVCSPAEELGNAVEGPIDRVISNAAFWQMQPLETLTELGRIASDTCRVVCNMMPEQLGNLSEDAESIYAPSLPGPDRPPERNPHQRDLGDWMIEIATSQYGYEAPADPAPSPQAQAAQEREYEARFMAAIQASGFRVAHKEIFWVRITVEAQYAWLEIPIFRRKFLPTMDAETSGLVLRAAREKWLPSAAEYRTPMLDIVLVRT